MPPRKRVQVVPNSKGPKNQQWKVLVNGRLLSSHRKQSTAIEAGRKNAKNTNNSQLLIHRRNGTVRDERTYGNDPYPPRG